MKKSSTTELPERPPLPAEPPDAAAIEVPPSAGHGVPALGELLDAVDARDRLMARIVRLLLGHDFNDAVASACGVSMRVWLQQDARLTRAEARDVLAAVEVLARMPATLRGLSEGWLSWSQTQAICAAARTVTVALQADLDGHIAGLLVEARGWEPDGIVELVWEWADRMRPSRLERAEAAAARGEMLTMAPRLFGGGSIYAELGTESFAIAAEALDAPLGPPVAVPDDLDDLDDPDAVDAAFDRLDAQRRALTRGHGRQLAARFVAICEASLAGRHADATTVAARPLLLGTIGLEALLDRDRTPGWLLHTLAGGRMKVTSTLLQRLVDDRGADLRTIVLDDAGEAVEVGHRSYVPPRWLRETIWARDLAVREPNGATPVRRADLDHITEWPAGPTDADNLQPLGRRAHNAKTSGSWTITRARDGTITFTHRRTGWTITRPPPRRRLEHPPPDDPGPPRPPLDLDPPDHRDEPATAAA